MKKIISVFLLVVFVNLGVNSQNQRKKVSLKQQVERTLKRMTTQLELSKDQQEKIKPLLLTQLKDRRKMMQKRKQMQTSGVKLSKQERKLLRENRLEKEQDMQKSMQSILTEEQYAQFLKMKEKQKQKRQ
ncbi:hypothetical protein [uncultured Polaribacter sp.]|uniref:hypothetical protein n=1 Tax=uncultured Polaribacter sp. TaxID=174711 RepID=UPI00260BEAFF|nr:hypothetical protein [uncultured Polaribacter sp.]